MLLAACKHGVSRGWRHYFYGGHEGVAEELRSRLTALYPGLQVVGATSPPFRELTPEEIQALAQELREKRVDFLWVALGGKRQETWMRQHLGHLPVPVMLGVGAAFDFHTERQRWAPHWMQHWGLEWLWRFCTGGKRLFKRNLLCVSHIALRLALAYLCRLQYLFRDHPLPQRRNLLCGLKPHCGVTPCHTPPPQCPHLPPQQ